MGKYNKYVSLKEIKDNEEFEKKQTRLIQELGNETMNLVQNFMLPEDIKFVLNKGDDNA